MDGDTHHLLICTVGGTPEPIVAAIGHWKPARVLFVYSPDTEKTAKAVTKDTALLQPGAWDLKGVNDEQDFGDCVRQMRSLDEQIENWLRKGPEYDVIIDFTGGTKCMSAALSLVSRRWPCAFSYVGGTERTKGGTGIVVSGKEQTLVTQNPWNALGYQAIEDACLLFDQHAFMPAANLLDDARKAADDHAVKRCLSTFHQLCEGYGLWDRFQHKDAVQRIANVLKNATDVQVVLRSKRYELVIRAIQLHHRALHSLVAQPRSLTMVADLLANALRRKQEGRYDDGVARLYRAIESIAQLALAERHGIPTDCVALESIPEPLREGWAPRAEGGKVPLGLQEAYALLDELGDKAGEAFRGIGLHDPQRSPLTARNQSILAHGFHPVGQRTFDALWDTAMKLGELAEADLPTFPRLRGDLVKT